MTSKPFLAQSLRESLEFFRRATFALVAALFLSSGCGKPTQINPSGPSAARAKDAPEVSRTNRAPADAERVPGNVIAARPIAENPKTLSEPSKPALVAAKVPPPAQEIYEQALACMRTNATAAAAEEAVILFRSAAEKGNPAAEHALGVALLSGLGITKNVEDGLKWLEKSADQKNPDALFKLASLHIQGVDLPRDEVKAAALAREAAELGQTEAQYNVASLYATGHGVQKDLKEAARWYEKAAEAGHATAQSNLGVLYATGEGVEKNPATALKWWQKAAEQGQPSAQFNLAHALKEGKIVAQDRVEAYKWYNLAAEQGDADAETARDALAVDISPEDLAAALRRAREFKTQLYAKVQEQHPLE